MPLFSIVTPTRNRPDVLRVALDSALTQSCGDFELLLVDDASDDDAAARLVRESGDERIRLIRNEETEGPSRGGAPGHGRRANSVSPERDTVQLEPRANRSYPECPTA